MRSVARVEPFENALQDLRDPRLALYSQWPEMTKELAFHWRLGFGGSECRLSCPAEASQAG